MTFITKAHQNQTLPPNPESTITTELTFQNLRPQKETKKQKITKQKKTPVSESQKPHKAQSFNIFTLRKCKGNLKT